VAISLKIDPKLEKIFGYDIIITKKNAIFAMEKCEQPNFQ
jgi:hypothetical protein